MIGGKSELIRDAVLAVGVTFSLVMIGRMSRKLWASMCSREKSWVVFFPDSKLVCMNHVRSLCKSSVDGGSMGCGNSDCTRVHDRSTAFASLIYTVAAARRAIEVCMFTFTAPEMSEVLMLLRKYRNVEIRVLVDSDQRWATNSQVEKLHEAGVSVRCNPPGSCFLHHKFMIVDGLLVITGSFNWTKTAVVGNHENAICITEDHIVKGFQGEFEKLWAMYESFTPLRR